MNEGILRQQLISLLGWENAHVNFETATANVDLKSLGNDSHALPYSIWQLAEHIRFAQKDIVDFCIGKDYHEPKWPDDYWPKTKAPESREEWERCLHQVQQDRHRMAELIRNEKTDLFKPFAHGTGQHLFREVMLIVDHEAYHTGQIVLIRKILGKWG